MITPPFGVPAGTSAENVEAALRSDVATRLKNVCAHWTNEDFQKLVDDVTRTALKYVIATKSRT